MALEIGLVQGLAYRHNFQADIANATRLKGIERQYEQDARNRNALIANEIKFGTAVDPWNQKLLEVHTDKVLLELEKIYEENPDIESNLPAFLNFKNTAKKLYDNEPVKASMRVQEERQKMKKYFGDPANSMYKDGKEMNEELSKYDNYIKTGSTTGIAGDDNEFFFTSPGSSLNLMEILSDSAEGITMGGYFDNGFTAKRFVKAIDISKAAQILKDGTGPWAAKINNEWEYMKKDGRAENYDNQLHWLIKSLEPLVKSPLFKSSPYARAYGRAGDPRERNTERKSILMGTLNSIRSTPYHAVQAHKRSAEAVFVDADGNNALNNITMFHPKDLSKEIINHISGKYNISFADSKLMVVGDPNRPEEQRAMISSNISMSYNNVKDLWGRDVVDEANWFWGNFWGNDEFRSSFATGEGQTTGTDPGINQYIIKEGRLEEGGPLEEIIEFTVWRELNFDNPNTISEYDREAGAGTYKLGLGDNNNKRFVDEFGDVWEGNPQQ